MRSLILAAIFTAAVTAPALACGVGSNSRAGKIEPPPIAAAFDTLFPKANLSDADRDEANKLRAQIDVLVARKDEKGAREVETEAMRKIGYQKGWMACGPGTFFWMPINIGKPRSAPVQS